MRNYEERAKDFIKEIYPYLETIEFNRFYANEAIHKYNNEHNRHVIIASGIARVALITSDYVVKYDYNRDHVNNVGGGESEVYMYEVAKEEGYDYLFAKVSRYVYNNHYFYIMPRIRYITDRVEYAQDFMTDDERQWCDSHDIDDLHSFNYGFREGKVCIVDYACNENVFEH